MLHLRIENFCIGRRLEIALLRKHLNFMVALFIKTLFFQVKNILQISNPMVLLQLTAHSSLRWKTHGLVMKRRCSMRWNKKASETGMTRRDSLSLLPTCMKPFRLRAELRAAARLAVGGKRAFSGFLLFPFGIPDGGDRSRVRGTFRGDEVFIGLYSRSVVPPLSGRGGELEQVRGVAGLKHVWDYRLLYRLIGAVQSIGSLSLIALFIPALRRRFKMD